MKRIITLAVTASLLLAPATASAQPVLIPTPSDPSSLFSLKVSKPTSPDILLPPKKEAPKPKPAEPVKPQPVVYTVIEGDNLTKIGTAHKVEWQRLWAKNTQLEHPDRINVGDKITIPLADEVLQRDIPAAVALPAITPGVETPRQEAGPAVAVPVPVYTAPAGNYGGGNTYDYGYCTWYVKNRRGSSIPNTLGNANTWYYRAQSMGMATGSVPRAGAVGTTTRGALGHVVYVESVNGDGTINISEMNYKGFGITSYRTTSASEFVYIY